jgi:hypothetical protein
MQAGIARFCLKEIKKFLTNRAKRSKIYKSPERVTDTISKRNRKKFLTERFKSDILNELSLRQNKGH